MATNLEHGYVKTSLGELHFARQGEGPPLLLIPQSGRSHGMFDGLIARLRDRFQTVTFDLPGSGRSAPLDPRTTYEAIADATLELCQALRLGRPHLYGIHTGNKIATALAARHPPQVGKVILVGQSHSIIPDQEERNAAVLSHMASIKDDRSDPLVAAADWGNVFAALSRLWFDASVMRNVNQPAARLATIGQAVDLLTSFEAKPFLYRMNLDYDLGRDLALIEAPTLLIEIVTQTESRDHGRQGQRIAKLVRDFRICEIHHSDGFALTLERKEDEVAPLVIGFLEETQPSQSRLGTSDLPDGSAPCKFV